MPSRRLATFNVETLFRALPFQGWHPACQKRRFMINGSSVGVLSRHPLVSLCLCRGEHNNFYAGGIGEDDTKASDHAPLYRDTALI